MKYALIILCLNLCPALSLGGGRQPLNGPGYEAPRSSSQDIAPDEHAFVELETQRETYFVHEKIRMRIRFGIDTELLKNNVIPMFRRNMDLPVQVCWIDDTPGTAAFAGKEDTPDKTDDRNRLSFAFNDSAAEALRVEDRMQGSRRFTVLEIERSYMALKQGELVIPEPLLRFAYATKFEKDILSGQKPVDRKDAAVSGGKLILTIKALPEEGRPDEFTGAVGSFSLRAEADPQQIELGKSLRLVLRIEGDGNLDIIDPPHLDRLVGFHVYGSIAEKNGNCLSVTYDIMPLSKEVREVPPIRFAFFDTGPPPAYRFAQTQPIPLELLPPPDGEKIPALLSYEPGRAKPGETDIFGLKPIETQASGSRTPPSLSSDLLVWKLLFPWLVALGSLFGIRAIEKKRRDPGGVRARGAAAAYRKRANRPGTELDKTFAEFLGARLRCPAAAVIGPGLSARLREAGVRDDLATRAAALLKSLNAARYAGDTPAADHALGNHQETAEKLVDELEASFRDMENAS